jgi:hypothetical protein
VHMVQQSLVVLVSVRSFGSRAVLQVQRSHNAAAGPAGPGGAPRAAGAS